MPKTYQVNEVFYSLQGEGVRAGTANVFIRFSGCNLACSMEPGQRSPGGFDCDTEFTSGRKVTLDELMEWVLTSHEMITTEKSEGDRKWALEDPWLILTGGEPGLQVDREFIDYWHNKAFRLAIETNGTLVLPDGIDWITLSPKVAEHAVKQLWANELKYVRGYGQAIPRPAAIADHYIISPAFDAMSIHPKTLEWCIKLCLQNPQWRLSLQTHKLMKVR